MSRKNTIGPGKYCSPLFMTFTKTSPPHANTCSSNNNREVVSFNKERPENCAEALKEFHFYVWCLDNSIFLGFVYLKLKQ